MTNVVATRGGVKLSACSDPAIAGHMLAGELRGLIHCEGWFWRYDGDCWQPISSAEIQQIAMSYDQRKVGGRTITLGSHRLASIEHCLRLKVAKPGFFDEQLRGINCANGLLSSNLERLRSSSLTIPSTGNGMSCPELGSLAA